MSNAVPMENQGRAHRYLAGRMSAEETTEFETYMLEHPEVLDEVALQRRMKAGLASLRQKGELDGLVRSHSSVRRRYLGLAASVIAALGLVSWYLAVRERGASPIFSATLDSFGGRVSTAPPLDELVLVRNRSGDAVSLALPDAPRVVLLRVVAGAVDADAAFDLELVRSSPAPETVLRRIEDLRADPQGMLSAYFDPRAAGPGAFMLKVHHRASVGGHGEVTEYPFEVR